MARSLETLTQDLRRRHGKSLRAAIRAIGAMGPAATSSAPALIALINDPEYRHACEAALRRIGSNVATALTDALGADSETVRASAVSLLAEIRPTDPTVLSALNRMLEDSAPRVRFAAAKAMGSMACCDTASIKPLTSLLSDPSWETREGAALALRLHGVDGREALDCLMTLLADESTRVKRAAALALQALDHEASPAVPALTEALHDPDRGVRGRVVFALARIGKTAECAVPLLVEAQRIHDRHRDWTVAWSGALALVHLGRETDEAIPALTEILCGIEDNYIASELFIALDRRRLDEPFAPRHETPPLHTARAFLRRLALEHLIRIGRECELVRKAIERVQDDRDPIIRDLSRKA